MAININLQLSVSKEIREINNIKDADKRLNSFLFVRERVQREINDDMDELFSAAELRKDVDKNTKNENDKAQLKKIIEALSIFYTQEESDIHDYNTMYNHMQESIERLYWYDKQILELYLELGNYRDVGKQLGIPWESCYKTIQNVILKIRTDAKFITTGFRKNKSRLKNEWTTLDKKTSKRIGNAPKRAYVLGADMQCDADQSVRFNRE